MRLRHDVHVTFAFSSIILSTRATIQSNRYLRALFDSFFYMCSQSTTCFPSKKGKTRESSSLYAEPQAERCWQRQFVPALQLFTTITIDIELYQCAARDFDNR